MVCLHCPTLRSIPRQIKTGLYRIVWTCSHCTDTDDKYRLLLGSEYMFSVAVSILVLVLWQCEQTNDGKTMLKWFVGKNIIYIYFARLH